jgi:hypothetical protein
MFQARLKKKVRILTTSMPKHTIKKDVESTWQIEDGMWDRRFKGKKKKKKLGGHKYTKPPKNYNHKYNCFAIYFFGNV